MASGNTLVVLYPNDAEPPASNYATFDTRNQHPVLDFDDTTNESINFTAVMPQNYANGGVTAYIHYSMTSATANNVAWSIAFERIGNGSQDTDTDGFATAQSVTGVTVPATSGNVGVTSIAFTNGAQMDSVVAGELFRIQLTRLATTDTAAGDAEIHAIEIRET